MFETHFPFLLTVFIKDIKMFVYVTSINDEKTITSREIIKTIYKFKSNETSEMNEITNRALRQFVNVMIK